MRNSWTGLFLLIWAVGCDEPSTTPSSAEMEIPPSVELATRFDMAQTGSLYGRVRWQGQRPVVPVFRSIENPLTDQPNLPVREWPNPNAPVINSEGMLSSAVVFLRGVDPAQSRPWNHAAVRVELRNFAFDRSCRFVRAGDEVEIVSRQGVYHAVQVRGVHFESLMLPDPEQPRRMRFSKPGVVELLSGAGLFWMRDYLFVDHHPYYSVTNSKGEFHLSEVPQGEYDLVVWHPNWQVQRTERNADSFRIQQVRFAAPLEQVQRVRIERGQQQMVEIAFRSPSHPE